MKLYKATRPDGTDFRTGTVDYAAALASGQLVAHPYSKQVIRNAPATYLSVSVEPPETLIGGSWPARLFVVKPYGSVVGDMTISKHKRGVLGMYVLEELPGWMALGPNGEEVAAIIERAKAITFEQAKKMDATQVAARVAARLAARIATQDAARVAARVAARDSAWAIVQAAARRSVWDAVLATLVKDLIPAEQHEILMKPWLKGLK